MKWIRVSTHRWNLFAERGNGYLAPCAHLDRLLLVGTTGPMRKRRKLHGPTRGRVCVIGLWESLSRGGSTIVGATRDLKTAMKTAEAMSRINGWR